MDNQLKPSENAAQEQIIAEMISDWLIQIHSDDLKQQQQAQYAYTEWKKQHPEYLYITEKLEDCFTQMQLLQQQSTQHRSLIQPLFDSKNHRNKRVIKSGILLFIGCIPFIVYLQQNSPRYLLADVRSKTGEWRTEILDDGTKITLKNKTAFNVHYSHQQRVIELVTGDVLIDVAVDKNRPFTVLVQQGSIQALGTKFTVNYQAQHTDLIMLESKVLVKSSVNNLNKNVVRQKKVQAGERIYLNNDGIQTMPNIDIQTIEYQWKNKKLVAEEQPLTEVLAQLNQYHRGKIYYNQQQLANIKVTAVIPLDNTDNAIKLLQKALPQLMIKDIGGYVYWVENSATKY